MKKIHAPAVVHASQTMAEAISVTEAGKTLIVNAKQQANDAATRVHKLFQLADFTFILCDSVQNPAVGKHLVKVAEANIRAIGQAGGKRYQNVTDNLYFAHQSYEDWKEAAESILHG